MFKQTMLIGYFVSYLLLTNILQKSGFIHSYRADKIAFASEMTVPKLIFQVRKLLEYH